MPNMALCQQSSNKFKIWPPPPPSLDIVHRHVFFCSFSFSGTTSFVDQTAFVITAVVSPSLSFRCFYGFLFPPGFSPSLSPPLSLYLSIYPSLPHFLRLYHFSIVWPFSMHNIRGIFCVWNLRVQRCLGSIMFQTQVWGSWYLGLFYAQSKGLSVIEFVHVKDLWDLCKIMNSYLHHILSLRSLYFEFDRVAILGIIVPWVPLCTQSPIFFAVWTWACNNPPAIPCIELFYP